jgi:hypothetical protein
MQPTDQNESDPDADTAIGTTRQSQVHLPLVDADQVQTGTQIPFFRERLTHWGDNPHWQPLDFSDDQTSAWPQ